MPVVGLTVRCNVSVTGGIRLCVMGPQPPFSLLHFTNTDKHATLAAEHSLRHGLSRNLCKPQLQSTVFSIYMFRPVDKTSVVERLDMEYIGNFW